MRREHRFMQLKSGVFLLAGLVMACGDVRTEPAVLMVDINHFRTAQVDRGRRTAEDDIANGRQAFYVATCTFPRPPSKADLRRLERIKRGLRKIGVKPIEYVACGDVVESATRIEAFVEGYNGVSGAELSRRHGEDWGEKVAGTVPHK